MPRTRAPRKRSRASKRRPQDRPADEWVECPPPTSGELFQQMSEALREAIAFMQALRLMGLGMNELGRDEGDAVLTVADATSARLEIVQDAWLNYVQAERCE
jgi:hypothetical protein